MTDLRKAAEQALDALETAMCDAAEGGITYDECLSAIAAIKEALAQPEQEPVAQPEQGCKTGWPAGMLQDDSRELSKALASKPDSKQHAREAAHGIKENT